MIPATTECGYYYSLLSHPLGQLGSSGRVCVCFDRVIVPRCATPTRATSGRSAGRSSASAEEGRYYHYHFTAAAAALLQRLRLLLSMHIGCYYAHQYVHFPRTNAHCNGTPRLCSHSIGCASLTCGCVVAPAPPTMLHDHSVCYAGTRVGPWKHICRRSRCIEGEREEGKV